VRARVVSAAVGLDLDQPSDDDAIRCRADEVAAEQIAGDR
jgi:hypothetical protein